MLWIYIVTAAGIYAWVNFCSAEEVGMCSGGKASAQNITLNITLNSSTFKCCCHIYFDIVMPVWRRKILESGIMLADNISFFNEDNTSISLRVTKTNMSLCVFRKVDQNQLLQGQLILQASDIHVNCSEPIQMRPSTISPQGNSSSVIRAEQLWIIIACGIGGVLMATITVCTLCVYRKRRQLNSQSKSDQGNTDICTPKDDDDLVMTDNFLYSAIDVNSGGSDNAEQRQPKIHGVP